MEFTKGLAIEGRRIVLEDLADLLNEMGWPGVTAERLDTWFRHPPRRATFRATPRHSDRPRYPRPSLSQLRESENL